MLARVLSAAVNGIEAYPVEVEVNCGWGDTVIVIVGLPDVAVKESRDRVSTALTNSGFKFPMGRSTINLAPADVKKEGPSFDLPIAIGMLAASEQLCSDQLDNFVMVCCRWRGGPGRKAGPESSCRRKMRRRRRWCRD
jgi:magnesium chelatase family protein